MFLRWTTSAQRRWAFWLCAAAVLALCLMPPAGHLPDTGWDKSNHALAFAVLAVLGLFAYEGRTLGVLTSLVAFGALIELLQSLTGYRTAEWLDLFADSVGIAAGWPVALWLGAPRAPASAA